MRLRRLGSPRFHANVNSLHHDSRNEKTRHCNVLKSFRESFGDASAGIAQLIALAEVSDL
jgi:hypothetical protein